MPNQIDNDCTILGGVVQGYGQQQILSLSGSTRLYSGHINASNLIEIRYSDDGGVTWTWDTTFSEAAESMNFSMCRSDLDDIFVCFWNTSSGQTKNVFVKKRDHTAGTWSTPLTQVCGVQNVAERLDAMIVFNRNINRLHLIVTIHSYGFGYLGIYGNYSNDYGTTWIWNGNFSGASVAPALIYQYTSTSSYPYSCYLWGVDTSVITGQIFITWATTYSTQLYTTRCNADHTANTNLWSYAMGGQGYGGGCNVTDNVGNNYACVNFYDYSYAVYRTRVYLNSGTLSLDINWGGTQIVVTGQVCIGVDSSNHVYLFYTKVADGLCYYRYFNGSTWGTETALVGVHGSRPSCELHSKPSSAYLQVSYISNA